MKNLASLSLLSGALLCTLLISNCKREVGKPNIILIMADDHAVKAISAYGSKLIETTHIDQLAEQGIKVENYFSTNSICNPGRASIMTGKYSHVHGINTNYLKPGNKHVTYPELMKKAGYQTALVGKTHFHMNTNCIQSLDYYMISHGAEYHNPKFLEKGKEVQNYDGYVTDIVTSKGIDWIEKCDKSKPFLMMLHHPAPHMPFQEKEEMLEPLSFNDPGMNQPDSPRPQNITMEGLMGFQGRKHIWGENAWEPPEGLEGEPLKKWIYQRYMRAYLACVQSLDENVGKLLKSLKKHGLDKNTIVIYTSDQGFFLGEHGWYDKRFFYEESIRMPLIIRYPGGKSGRRSEAMVLNVDLPESILDFAGVSIPEDMQGESGLPLLSEKAVAEWREAMYYHYYESQEDSPLPVRKHYGIRTGSYKLIRFYGDANDHWELYDLMKDPNELHNLIDENEVQEEISKLKIQPEELRHYYNDTNCINGNFI